MERVAELAGVRARRGIGLAATLLLAVSTMIGGPGNRGTGFAATLTTQAAPSAADDGVRSCPAAVEPSELERQNASAQGTGLVRIVYVVPNDKMERGDYLRAIENAVRNIQFWISQELGGPTFRLLLNVQTYRSSYPSSWFTTNEEFTSGDPKKRFHENVVREALRLAGPGTGLLRTVAYIDADPACVNGEKPLYGWDTGKNVAVIPANDLRGLVGETVLKICPTDPPKDSDNDPCRWIGGLGHELGHAFGRPHPPYCDANPTDPQCDRDALMYVGYQKYPFTYLRSDDKENLRISPFMWENEPTAQPTSCVRQSLPRRRPVRIASIPSQMGGGTSVTAWVDISEPAPPGGLVVSLASSAPGAASVPASVSVAAGANVSQTFTLATSVVASPTPVTITATYDGSSVTARLTVNPPVYEGYFDIADCSALRGWAWDQNRPNTPINVDIFEGSTLLATVTANGFRQDLLNAGKGNGYHGFSWSVPASLKNGAAHPVTVRIGATTTALGGSPRTINCAPSPSAPVSPSGLNASVLSASRIDVRWTDNSGNETGFEVYARTSPTGSYSRVGAVGTNATAFAHGGLASGSTFYYVVRAINAAGSSANSNEVVASSYANGAAFVSQTPPPGLMTAGQSYGVSITMRNTGTSTWSPAFGDLLGSQNPAGNSTWGLSQVLLPGSVAPGAEVTLAFTVTAPPAPGTYNFQWRMAHQQVQWFGTSTANVPVTVQAAAGAGLVGHWKLDEGTGGTSADSSGNANHVTLLNNPVWTAGQLAGALSFDGLDDSLIVWANASLTGVTNTFTTAMWVNPQAAHEIDSEMTTGFSGTSGQRYAIGPHHGANYGESGHAGAGISVGTNGVSVYEHASGYMPAVLVHPASITGWTHVAVVYENRHPRLYVNGILVKTGLAGPYGSVHLTPVNIGGMGAGYFKGLLDDVRVYGRALTATDIQALAGAAP